MRTRACRGTTLGLDGIKIGYILTTSSRPDFIEYTPAFQVNSAGSRMAPHIYQALPKETWGPDETTPTSESFHSTPFIDRSRLSNYVTRYGFAIYVFSTVLISAISFFAGMRLENLRTDLPKVCWRMHNMYSQFKQLSS